MPKLTLSLQLDREAGQPLYTQLRDGLTAWIQQQPDGSRIPSERQLADSIVVNRRTLHRAVEELEDRGLLERRGRRLFVRRPRLALDGDDPVPHTFVTRTVDGLAEQASLRIAVYENLPWQQACWNEIRDMFNESHPNMRLELHMVPMSVNTDRRYLDYVQQHGCDLLLGPQEILAERNRTALMPLAPETAALVRSGALCLPNMRPDIAADEPVYGAALHFCMWMCLVNTELLNTRTLAEPTTPLALTAWLRDQTAELPSTRKLLAVPSEFLNVLGHPPLPMTPEALVALLDLHGGLIRTLQPVFGRVDQPMQAPGEYSHSQAAKLFAQGELAAYVGPSYCVLGMMKASSVHWRMVDIALPEGYRRSLACTCVGITRVCQNVAAANELVAFLLSDVAQSVIARAGVNCPMNPAGQAVLARYITRDDPGRLARLTARYTHRDRLSEIFEPYMRFRAWSMLAQAARDQQADMQQVRDELIAIWKREHPELLI